MLLLLFSVLIKFGIRSQEWWIKRLRRFFEESTNAPLPLVFAEREAEL